MVSKWAIRGISTASKLKLKPQYLAAEGIPHVNSNDAVVKIVKRTGWVVEVNVLFESSRLRLVRRNALGVERAKSNAGLPTTIELI